MDALIKAVLDVRTAEEAISLCIPLLRQESSAASAGTALLERIRVGMEEKNGVTSIMRALRCHMIPHSTITAQILQLLPLVDHPQPLIDALPQLVCANPADMGMVVMEYKKMLNSDRALLVPLIGSLYDLPLQSGTRTSVLALSIEVLSIVDEDDLPVIVRTLIRAIGERDDCSSAVESIRRECCSLNDETLMIITDVLAEELPQNSSIAKAYLAVLIRKTQYEVDSFRESNTDHTKIIQFLSNLDVAILLILLPLPQYAYSVERILLILSYAPSLVPWDSFILLAQSASSESQWFKLFPALIDVSLWFLTSPVRTISKKHTDVNSKGASELCDGACEVLFKTFEAMPQQRYNIVSSCLAVSNDLSRAAFGENLTAATKYMLIMSATSALNFLQRISKEVPEMLVPFSSIILEFAMDGIARLQPTLLQCIAQTLATLAPHIPSTISTLLTFIQKQLFIPLPMLRSTNLKKKHSPRIGALLMTQELINSGNQLAEPKTIYGWTNQLIEMAGSLLSCPLYVNQTNAHHGQIESDDLFVLLLALKIFFVGKHYSYGSIRITREIVMSFSKSAGLFQTQLLGPKGSLVNLENTYNKCAVTLFWPEHCNLNQKEKTKSNTSKSKQKLKEGWVCHVQEFVQRCKDSGFLMGYSSINTIAEIVRTIYGNFMDFSYHSDAILDLPTNFPEFQDIPLVLPAWPISGGSLISNKYGKFDFDFCEIIQLKDFLKAEAATYVSEAAVCCAVAQGVLVSRLTNQLESNEAVMTLLASHLEFGLRLRCCIATLYPLFQLKNDFKSVLHDVSMYIGKDATSGLEKYCTHAAGQIPFNILCGAATWHHQEVLETVECCEKNTLKYNHIWLIDFRTEILEILTLRLAENPTHNFEMNFVERNGNKSCCDSNFKVFNLISESCRLDILLNEAEQVGLALPRIRILAASQNVNVSKGKRSYMPKSAVSKFSRLYVAYCRFTLQCLISSRKFNLQNEFKPLPMKMIELSRVMVLCDISEKPHEVFEKLFEKLKKLLELCLDSLAALILLECMSNIVIGLPKASSVAYLCWHSMRCIYPLGHGTEYETIKFISNIGIKNLTQSLLRRPLSLRAILASFISDDTYALKQLESICLSDPPNPPEQGFVYRSLVYYWCLSGPEDGNKGLNIILAALQMYNSEPPNKKQKGSSSTPRADLRALTSSNFVMYIGALSRLLPATLLASRPKSNPEEYPYKAIENAVNSILELFSMCIGLLERCNQDISRSALPVLQNAMLSLRAASWQASYCAKWRATQPSNAEYASNQHLLPLFVRFHQLTLVSEKLSAAARKSANAEYCSSALGSQLQRNAAALSLQSVKCSDKLFEISNQQNIFLPHEPEEMDILVSKYDLNSPYLYLSAPEQAISAERVQELWDVKLQTEKKLDPSKRLRVDNASTESDCESWGSEGSSTLRGDKRFGQSEFWADWSDED